MDQEVLIVFQRGRLFPILQVILREIMAALHYLPIVSSHLLQPQLTLLQILAIHLLQQLLLPIQALLPQSRQKVVVVVDHHPKGTKPIAALRLGAIVSSLLLLMISRSNWS